MLREPDSLVIRLASQGVEGHVFRGGQPHHAHLSPVPPWALR